MPEDLAIAVRGLDVRYGNLNAVRGLDMTVSRGEVVAFLGPERGWKDDDRGGHGGISPAFRRRGSGAWK